MHIHWWQGPYGRIKQSCFLGFIARCYFTETVLRASFLRVASIDEGEESEHCLIVELAIC